MRYLILAVLVIPVWILSVAAELLGKSVQAAKTNTEPRGAHLFPAPVIVFWAVIGVAYTSDSNWFSQEPFVYNGFWFVSVLLMAFALYASGCCIHDALALRALRRHTKK